MSCPVTISTQSGRGGSIRQIPSTSGSSCGRHRKIAARPGAPAPSGRFEGSLALWRAHPLLHCEKKRRQVVHLIIEMIAQMINLVILLLLGVLATERGLQLALPKYRAEAFLATACGAYLIWLNRPKGALAHSLQELAAQSAERRNLRAQLRESAHQLDSAKTRIRRLETLRAQGETWRILQDGNIRLESCTERALEQLLRTTKGDLMLALAKVRAAPICQISYNAIVDERDLIVLNTNPLKAYQRGDIFHWILERGNEICPTTKQRVQAMIAPSSGRVEFYRGSEQERRNFERDQLPSCLRLFEDEMRCRRQEALLSVNVQFGRPDSYLELGDLAPSGGDER